MRGKPRLKRNNVALNLSALALAVGVACTPSYAARIEVNTAVDKLLSNSADATCSFRDALISVSQGTFNNAGAASNQANGCNLSSTGALGTNDLIEFNDSLDNSTITVLVPPFGLPLDKRVTVNSESRNISISMGKQSRHFAASGGPTEPVTINKLRLIDGVLDGGGTNAGSSIGVFLGTTLTITNSTIESNTAALSAAIWVVEESSKVIIEDSIIRNNTGQSANSFGGGILLNLGGDMELRNSTVSGNSVNGRGGGFSMGVDGGESIVLVENSAITGNDATIGGGIDVVGGTLTLNNATISENTADDIGGISIIEGSGLSSAQAKLMMYNATIAFNTSQSVGGLRVQGPAEAVIKNSILAKSSGSSTANANCIKDVSASFTGDAFSIIQNNLSSGFGVDVDPGLIGLSKNGASTSTHALKLDSLAANTGDNTSCLADDQRGTMRPLSMADVCDVGAFEQTEQDRKNLLSSFIVVPLAGKKAVVIPN